MFPKDQFHAYARNLAFSFDEVIMVNRRNPFTEVGRRSSVSGIAREFLDELSNYIPVKSFSIEEIYEHPSIVPRRGFEEYNLNTGIKFLHESEPIRTKPEDIEQYKQTIKRLCADVNSYILKFAHLNKKILYFANDFQMIDTIKYIDLKDLNSVKCFILHEPFNYIGTNIDSVRFTDTMSLYDFIIFQDEKSNQRFKNQFPYSNTIVSPVVPPQKLFYNSVRDINRDNNTRSTIIDSLNTIIHKNSEFDDEFSYQPIGSTSGSHALKDNALWVVGSMDRISEPKYLPERVVAFKLFIEKNISALIKQPVVFFLGNVRSIEGNHEHDLEFKIFKSWIRKANSDFKPKLGYEPLVDLGKVDEANKFSLMALSDLGVYTSARDGQVLAPHEHILSHIYFKSKRPLSLILSKGAGSGMSHWVQNTKSITILDPPHNPGNRRLNNSMEHITTEQLSFVNRISNAIQNFYENQYLIQTNKEIYQKEKECYFSNIDGGMRRWGIPIVKLTAKHIKSFKG